MKVLILSCNTGGGHNSAGNAIRGELQTRGHSVEMRDSLEFAGAEISKKLCAAYVSMTTKAPHVFEFLYKAGCLISTKKLKSPVYGLNTLYKNKIFDYVVSNGFEMVVMPHIFPAQTLTSLRKKLGGVKTLGIATDYTLSPFWEETELDAYIVPHRDIKEDYIKKGVPAEKVFPLGIPVSTAFSMRNNKLEMRKKLGLSENKKIVLIMTGSMGFGNAGKLTDLLYKKYGDKIDIIVLGGSNEKLKNSIRLRHAGHSNVIVKDFTDKVSFYMDACDVVLTKPGGLSSTEAAAKRVPLILTKPIPGCETLNSRFYKKYGLAEIAGNVAKELEKVSLLLGDESAVKKMEENQRNEINAFAASDICDLIENMYMKKESVVIGNSGWLF